MYPDTVINYDIVPRAQREFLEFQKNNQRFKDERGIERKDQFDNLSAEDGWFGSFTSKQKFVPLIERVVDESGREVSRIDMGLMNREGIPSSRRTASGSLMGFVPPAGADIQTWSDGKNYIIDPNSGDAVEVGQFAKQGNRFLKNGGESSNNLPKAAFGMLLLPGIMNRVNKAKETIKDNPQLLNLIAPGAGSMGSMAGMMQKGGEADGGMALQQMSAVMDKLGKLRKFIKPNSDLEPWISSKLAVMDHYADAVSDYMTYGDQYQDGGDVVNEYSANLPQMQDAGEIVDLTVITPYSRDYINNFRNQWIAHYNQPAPSMLRDDEFDDFFHRKQTEIPILSKPYTGWLKKFPDGSYEQRGGNKDNPPKSMGKPAKGFEWVENFPTTPERSMGNVGKLSSLIKSVRKAEQKKPEWNRAVKFKTGGWLNEYK
jgi:hypothetical protein